MANRDTLNDAYASIGVQGDVHTATAGVRVRGTRVTTKWESYSDRADHKAMKISALDLLEGALLNALDEVRALKRELREGADVTP